jgi:hypothetical protein
VLQVYNEVIYDLLVRSSGPLELREDPTAGPCVAGLKRVAVQSAGEIMVSASCLGGPGRAAEGPQLRGGLQLRRWLGDSRWSRGCMHSKTC